MINAPAGMSVGLPATAGSSCDVAPPPLIGGGHAKIALQSPLQSPLQVPVTGTGGLAPGVPTTAAATAAVGATTLAPAASTAITAAATAPPFTASVSTIAAPAVAAPVVGAPALVAPAVTTATTATTAIPSTVAPAVAPAATPAVTPQRLTSLAPGGQQADADLVESTLNVLRRSPSGAQVVDRLLAANARINVVADAELQAMGHGSAHAVYDPNTDTMFLRRSDLADAANIGFAAVALAHEGTHLLDDVGKVDDPFLQAATQRIIAAGGPSSAAGVEAQKQAQFEITMIKEARAFTYAGQVAKELGVTLPASDPTSVSAAGANDQATYARVWQALLVSSYNPERRAAPISNF